MTGRILRNHDLNSMAGWSLYEKCILAILNMRDRVIYAGFPSLSIHGGGWRMPNPLRTNRLDHSLRIVGPSRVFPLHSHRL